MTGSKKYPLDLIKSSIKIQIPPIALAETDSKLSVPLAPEKDKYL